VSAAVPSSRQGRRELYVNTLAAWVWTQGTLVASLVALPLLTHFLPKAEFGLWTQLLSVSALATVADFGLSSVFLRRITSAGNLTPGAELRAATHFYRTSGALLAGVLLVVCLIPGGLVAPFVGTTHLPGVTAVVIIAAIVVNLMLQPYTLRLLSSGRMDLESVFGAGPAVVGTLLTVIAAESFHSALAAGVAYAAVEIAFDIGLVILVRRSSMAKIQRHFDSETASLSWRELTAESWGILTIAVTPQLMVLIDAAIVGRVVGPAAVALYAVAVRISDLVRRFFSPFTESLFLSLCRTTGPARLTVERHAASLTSLIVTSGIALGCALAAIGSQALTLLFGKGYGGADGPMIVLLAAATIRSMYMPGLRRVQADAALGALPRWFLAGLIVHVPLAVALTINWSVLGTAISVLIAASAFEAWPAARTARQHPSQAFGSTGTSMTQLAVSLAAGGLLLLLAWWRLSFGGLSAIVTGLVAIVLGALAVNQLVRYLRSSRAVVVYG
jgi:O-antigen/teichoic acid export membrane protein